MGVAANVNRGTKNSNKQKNLTIFLEIKDTPGSEEMKKLHPPVQLLFYY